MNANSLLARLEELKKWQEKQQERLLQQQISREESRRDSPIPVEDTPKTPNKENPIVVRVEDPSKPKQPFLKRGMGLVRYKMTDEDRKKPYGQPIKVNRKKGERDNILTKNIDAIKAEGEIKDMSPLKVPQFDIKLNDESKDLKVDEETLVKQTISSINEIASQGSKLDDDHNETEHSKVGTYREFRQLNLKQFFGEIPEEIHEINENPQVEMSEDTLYEKNLERELLIFEALEEKLLNSSFSSTNSSILKILSSTPNKLKDLKSKRDKVEEKSECYSSTSSSNEKTTNSETCSSEDCVEETSDLNTSSETTLENEAFEEPVRKDDILTEKLRQLDEEIQNFRMENAMLQRRKLELEKQEELLKKERKEFERYILEEKVKIEFYLEDEKKQFAKEKLMFERYVKDVQNKTNRKERDEITTLKDEIANIREASKLKETRNATSQARLRNQIKNYEKEIGNLKEELDTVRKQNAKLTTSQRYVKKSDSKVLQEINKNLSKLTKDKENTSVEKILVESPKTLERKAKELVDENLVKTYEEVFGSVSLNESKSNEIMSKTEVVLEDRSKEIKYSNGNVKVISPDGNLITMKYFNGDTKETRLLEGVIKYYYAENESCHTTYPDGLEIIEFKDGQVETKRGDGTYEVKLPNGILKVTHPDKSENVMYPDGTKVNISNKGEKEIILPDGQKEIHTKEHMRREYLDGTVKILYPDGIQETRYSNGRIRIKDKDGKLLLDSHGENT